MSESRIELPRPHASGPMSLETTIAQRRSVRSYTLEVLTLEEIGQLLWAAQGITGKRDTQRTAPSAGGCHPLILYVCRSSGVWRYYPQGHYLRRHLERDIRDDLAGASWRQTFIASAPCVFIVSAIYERTTGRYEERGRLRFVPMDVGHATENLLLQAVALGLGGVPVGAFNDAAVEDVLALPGEEVPMYVVPVGHPR